MKEINLILEDNVYSEAERVLEEYGLEVKGVLETVLKRIARQGSAEFIFTKSPSPVTVEAKHTEAAPSMTPATIVKMSKTKAKSIFNEIGHTFNVPVIYSSLNSATNNYWANPEADIVKNTWYLILNDQHNRILRLFKMDCGGENKEINVSKEQETIISSMQSLIPRADKPHLINLQIYGDDTVYFRDKVSGVAFKPYLIDEVNY